MILSLETATDICSVALHADDSLVAEFTLRLEKAHSKKLAKLVDEILDSAEISREDLSAVAISKGPGSYTGLRIGTSLAKGICFGLNIPFIGINTLEALAWQIHNTKINQGGIRCPMIDARRMEVYYLLKNENFETVEKTGNLIVDESSFAGLLEKNDIFFFGNGSEKCERILGHHQNAHFIHGIKPSAKSVGDLASIKYRQSDFDDLAYFEPYYYKEFTAGKPKKLV